MPKRGGRFKRGDPSASVRSRRLCYDCYAGGPVDHVGWIVCKLRTNWIPENIPDEQRIALPVEMKWPARDHAAAHDMIDSVLDRDLVQLDMWSKLHDLHHFGYEQYVVWCRDQLNLEEANMKARPLGDLINSDRIARINTSTFIVDYHILRYDSGDAWGRGTIWYPGAGEKGSTLTRFRIDLISGNELVEEHYPGRWAALGYPRMTKSKALDLLHRSMAQSNR